MTTTRRGPYRMADLAPQPCPAAIVVAGRSWPCKRPQSRAWHPHERHEYRGRGDGYEIIVTWLEIIDKPAKADPTFTSLTRRR